MADWSKYPGETIVFTADWTDLLGTDTILGPVTVTVDAAVAGVAATIISTTGNLTKLYISGGIAYLTSYLTFRFATNGGQIFTPVKTIRFLPLNA